jgi:hypothetical protein
MCQIISLIIRELGQEQFNLFESVSKSCVEEGIARLVLRGDPAPPPHDLSNHPAHAYFSGARPLVPVLSTSRAVDFWSTAQLLFAQFAATRRQGPVIEGYAAHAVPSCVLRL